MTTQDNAVQEDAPRKEGHVEFMSTPYAHVEKRSATPRAAATRVLPDEIEFVVCEKTDAEVNVV